MRRQRGRFARRSSEALLLLAICLLVVSAVHASPQGVTALPSGGSHFATFAAPAISTQTQSTCTSKSTVTSASLGTIAAGSTVIILVSLAQGTAVTVSSVGTQSGATFTSDSSFFTHAGSVTNAGNVREEAWYRSDSTGGATFHTVVNISATTNFCVSSIIVTGANLGGAVDVVGTGTTGNNATAGDQQTTAIANDLVFGAIGIKTTATTQTLTQISGWTILQSNMATSGLGEGTLDESFAAAQKVNPSVTISTTLQWAAISISFQPTGVPSSAPTGLTLTADLSTAEHVSYTKPANQPSGTVSNYTVFTGAAGGACGTTTWSSWNQFTSAGGTSTAITVSSLSSATDYCYSVAEWNATGRGPMSSTSTAYTIPAIATAFSCGSATVTSMACTWTLPSFGAGGDSNVSIYAWSGGACSSGSQLIGTPSLGSGVTSKTVTGLSSATQYSFAVAVWSPGGTSLLSACQTRTTLAGSPTGLSITAETTTGLTAGWTNAAGTLANITGYTSTTACTGSWTSTSLGTSATTKAFTGLASATKYCVAIQDWSSSGTNGPVFTNGTTLPTAPTGLAVTAETTTSVSLSWTNPSGTLVNVTIYRWTGTSCSGSATGTSLGIVASATQSGLTAATEYSFETAAWSNGGTSATTSCVNGWTEAGLPTSVSASGQTTTGVTVSWTNPSGTIANNTVWVTTNACVASWSQSNSAGSGTSYGVTGLSAATKYCLGVQSWSTGGTSGVVYTNQTTLPNAVTGIASGALTSTTASVSWVNPSGTPTNITIYVGTSCSGAARIQSNSAGVVTTLLITGLLGAHTYCVAAQAFSAGGASTTLDFTNLTTLPGVPTGLTFSADAVAGFTATWTNPSGTLANLTVYVGTTCAAAARIQSNSAGVVTHYGVTGLSGATAYCVGIQAFSSSGAGGIVYGNETTLPGTPTSLAAPTIGTTSVGLTWTNPSGTLANLTVLYGTSCTGQTQLSAGVVTSYSVTGLTAGVSYCFGVSAWSAGGRGGTTYLNATTTSGAAASLWVGQITGSSVQLLWHDPPVTVANVTAYVGLACGGWQETISVGPSPTAYVASGLEPDTHYCFAIQIWSPTGGPLAYVNATTAAAGSGQPPAGGGGQGPGGTANGTVTLPVVGTHPISLELALTLLGVGLILLILGAALAGQEKWYAWIMIAGGVVLGTFGVLALLASGIL